MGSGATPGLIAGLIYFCIAFATGTPALGSLVGGALVTAVAVVIGLLIRAVYDRSTFGSHG